MYRTARPSRSDWWFLNTKLRFVVAASSKIFPGIPSSTEMIQHQQGNKISAGPGWSRVVRGRRGQGGEKQRWLQDDLSKHYSLWWNARKSLEISGKNSTSMFKPGLPWRNSRNFIGASCHILPVCEKLNFVKWRKKWQESIQESWLQE